MNVLIQTSTSFCHIFCLGVAGLLSHFIFLPQIKCITLLISKNRLREHYRPFLLHLIIG
uniref:Uncharacterized protein n=1 Tax=Anguilla anguilla TaxID=7936 RepID=A0A0E9SY98_ANGAN